MKRLFIYFVSSLIVSIALTGFYSTLVAQEDFAISESGAIIAYCYQPMQQGVHQIYVIDEHGSNNRKLINASIGLNHHDWSPDAQHLVAVGYVSQSTWSIYKFNYDGTGLTRLTTTSDVFDSEPAWSPDGNEIAFTRIYPNQNYRNEIWVMNADGSNQHYVGVEGFAAKWSPDGNKFIFTSIGDWGPPGLKGSDIKICDTTGSNIQQITHTIGDEWYPSWSPDGQKILFGYSEDGSYGSNEIYKMNSDTTGREPLTVNNSWDGTPRWSPDGSRICYASDISSYQHWEIYIMNNNGSNISRVTYTPSTATSINPVWMPVDSSTNVSVVSSPPECFYLSQNYPNPFNPTTSIKYQMPELSFVSIKIYDVLGNKIKTLVNEVKPAGSYEIDFNASGNASGIYFYQLKTQSYSETKKMILLE